MSPNLAKHIQARKRSGSQLPSGSLSHYTISFHQPQSNHTLETLAKMAKPSYDAKIFASNANNGSKY